MNEVLKVEQLSIQYANGHIALNDVNFSIGKGRKVALVGPNGAGKSTLLKSILQLEKYQKGTIHLFGTTQSLNKMIAQKVAYIPQSIQFNSKMPITVYETVLMGCLAKKQKFFKKATRHDYDTVIAALQQMQLEDLKNRQLVTLSGGQKQRVFLARALAQNAEFYILDEPLTGVDQTSEHIIMEKLNALAQCGKTILVIHHDLTTVEKYFDDVIWLNQHVVSFGSIKSHFTTFNYKKTYGMVNQPFRNNMT